MIKLSTTITGSKLLNFFCFYILIYSCSCATTKVILPTDDNLRTRVDQFYVYFKNENYEKFLEFSINKPVMNKKDAVKYLKDNYKFKVTSHQIDSIVRIDELNAKVIVIMNYIQDNKEHDQGHIDCWSFKNGNWYLADFARTLDWECK